MGVELAPGRISAVVALKAVAAVADRWEVPRGQRHLLLGASDGTANHRFSEIAGDALPENREVKAAVLERASHIVSIYDALHRLIAGRVDDRDAAANRLNCCSPGDDKLYGSRGRFRQPRVRFVDALTPAKGPWLAE